MLDRPKMSGGLESVIRGLQTQGEHLNLVVGTTAEAIVSFMHKDKSPEELKVLQEEYYKIFRDTFRKTAGVDPLTNISSGIPTITIYSREEAPKRFTLATNDIEDKAETLKTDTEKGDS